MKQLAWDWLKPRRMLIVSYGEITYFDNFSNSRFICSVAYKNFFSCKHHSNLLNAQGIYFLHLQPFCTVVEMQDFSDLNIFHFPVQRFVCLLFHS